VRRMIVSRPQGNRNLSEPRAGDRLAGAGTRRLDRLPHLLLTGPFGGHRLGDDPLGRGLRMAPLLSRGSGLIGPSSQVSGSDACFTYRDDDRGRSLRGTGVIPRPGLHGPAWFARWVARIG